MPTTITSRQKHTQESENDFCSNMTIHASCSALVQRRTQYNKVNGNLARELKQTILHTCVLCVDSEIIIRTQNKSSHSCCQEKSSTKKKCEEREREGREGGEREVKEN